VEEEELKGNLEVVNGLNGQVWNKAVHREVDSLDRAGTWNMVDKVEEGKGVSSK
jgi:hypothetical protein